MALVGRWRMFPDIAAAPRPEGADVIRRPKWRGARSWHCEKCGGAYASPIKVLAVSCPACTSPIRRSKAWMKPSEEA